jgi:hypothetical protein
MFLVVAALRLAVGAFSIRRIPHRLEFRPAQTVALGFALLAGDVLLLIGADARIRAFTTTGAG